MILCGQVEIKKKQKYSLKTLADHDAVFGQTNGPISDMLSSLLML